MKNKKMSKEKMVIEVSDYNEPWNLHTRYGQKCVY